MHDDQALATTQAQGWRLMPLLSIEQAITRRQSLVEFISKVMVKGVDYGPGFPGADKDTLLKPGAERLSTYFGLTPTFHIVETTEDWTGQDHLGEPFFYFWYKCKLHRSGDLIAEGEGSCNSWESKYRYRKAERRCPACGQAAIIKGKSEYGGGWLCWAKKGGCNAKYKDGDQAIEAQEVGRVLNPDPADQVNTIKKIAQKRSLIAAILLAVNASEFFTQDIEDMMDAIDGEYTVKQAPVPPTHRAPAPAPTAETANDTPAPAPAATKAPAADTGNGDAPARKPADLLALVNSRVQVPYENLPHLRGALEGELGMAWHWPPFSDSAGWQQAYDAAIAHAQAKVQAPAADAEPTAPSPEYDDDKMPF